MNRWAGIDDPPPVAGDDLRALLGLIVLVVIVLGMTAVDYPR